MRLDPNYAQAWAGKAHAHRLMVNSTPSGDIYDYQKSIEAINKALALDENQLMQGLSLAAVRARC